MGKNFYIYQADVYCDECGKEICQDFKESIKHPGYTWYDSNEYPKGPYSSDMNESDCPQHCNGCEEFLENPLTEEGYWYVRGAMHKLRTYEKEGLIYKGQKEIVEKWIDFYIGPMNRIHK